MRLAASEQAFSLWRERHTVLTEGEHAGASGYLVTLGEPLHAMESGDAAYVVVPATMSFNLRGGRITQAGALFTVALRKSAGAWKIAAWAWAKGTLADQRGD